MRLAPRSTYADLGEIYPGVRRYSRLSPGEERELGVRAAAGDEEARWALVNGNLQFVANIAGRRARYLHVPADDLFQEGVIGCYRAACRFDPEQGTKFLTYAGWWVKQAMDRCQHNYMTLRVPAYVAQKLRRDDGSETDDATLLAARQAQRVVRMSEYAADNGDREPSWENLFVDGRDERSEAEEREQTAARLDAVRGWLREMSPQTRERLERRFGLDGGDGATLAATGEAFGITRERIRQVETKAIRIMKERAREASIA
jgi:RNA polymerase sigma factor (sigma-70 family)